MFPMRTMIGPLSRLCIPLVGCARAGCPMESAAGIARMAADVSAGAHAGKFGAGVSTTSYRMAMPYRVLRPARMQVADIHPGTAWRDWLFRQKRP
ncbi:hypothetical protein ABB22_10155 [Stenotrophomonas nitritireducens]|uniref:Secreted protein n=1 Tax=Stenotrophomonas nitritireducens TaxID=83617 RepID=A0ABR5NIZ1_9GAMM|nr:hypothetical protein ABB22_10155 [Stenotrophomonas nitritireducens]